MLIQDIVAINACQRPHETALVFSDGREFTFLAQRDRIARAAGALASCARAGSNIAILSDNCPEYLELTMPRRWPG